MSGVQWAPDMRQARATMFTAVVMVGAGGRDGGAISWVQEARRAAAADLLDMLARQPLVSRVILVSPELGQLAARPYSDYLRSEPGSIHVGEALAGLVEQYDISHLLYLGGGAAPLLPEAELAAVLQRVAQADALAVTNNQFASDWLALTPAHALQAWTARLPRDNMLGWVLSAEAGLAVQALPPAASSRLDIDTPADLMALRLHPGVMPHLKQALEAQPLPVAPLQRAVEVLATPASHVFIGGRLAPDVWMALNKATRSWLRVVSEERGMVSSGRQARGEARSLLAAHIEAVGMEPFFDTLGAWAQAAFIDTRVLLAHHNLWPDDASRFASDLGRVAEVEDEWLRAFTAAAVRAPIPVILGGHGLLAGAMLALCEVLERS